MAKKTVDSENEQKAITLYEISEELQAITNKIQEQDGELKEGDIEALDKWQAALEEKAMNICMIIDKRSHDAAFWKACEERAHNKRKAIEKTKESLRKYLLINMKATKTKSIKGKGMFSVSLVDGMASVAIDDLGKIPFEFTEIETNITPKKALIKKELESGKDVPGAHLEYSDFSLRIS